MPEANVSKVGHGSKMGQNKSDCACVSVVFTCIPLVFHSPYIKQAGHRSIRLLQARFLCLRLVIENFAIIDKIVRVLILKAQRKPKDYICSNMRVSSLLCHLSSQTPSGARQMIPKVT